MNKNILYILLLLIAFQSTVAVADLHQAHQSGVEHIQFSDDTDSDNHHSNQQQDSTIKYDCHHCCHCHGVHCYYLEDFSPNKFARQRIHVSLEAIVLMRSRNTLPDLRPPIV